MISFQEGPGLKDGFWSASNTLMSFLGRLMLMNDQLRIFSASVLNLSTKLLRSGANGAVSVGVNSVKAKRKKEPLVL